MQSVHESVLQSGQDDVGIFPSVVVINVDTSSSPTMLHAAAIEHMKKKGAPMASCLFVISIILDHSQ